MIYSPLFFYILVLIGVALHCSACLQVVAIAKDVLQIVADKKGYSFTFTEHLFGGCSIDAHGDPLTTETLEACRAVSVWN